MWVGKRMLRTLIVQLAILIPVWPGSVLAAPSAPVISQVQTEKAFTWVLIHSDVPFLIPAFANAREGSASVTWGAVAGATRYEVRLRVNGQWLSWTSVGSDTF